jgi:endonuclease/exonuclease/phosphatase family metal-dependent hydrolase
VEIEYEVNLRPPDGVDIGAANLEGHLPAIRFGNTHLSLSEEEFVYAAAKLREKATKLLFPAR